MTDNKETIVNKCHEVHELLKKAYWAKDRNEQVTHKAISNSLDCAIFEINTERLVGFTRVITDYSTVYYLCGIFYALYFVLVNGESKCYNKIDKTEF